MTSLDSVALNSVALDQQWPPGLTDRESEVLFLVSRGISNKEIAQRLGLSDGTVKQHVHHIFRKTGARRRSDIVVLMATFGLHNVPASTVGSLSRALTRRRALRRDRWRQQ